MARQLKTGYGKVSILVIAVAAVAIIASAAWAAIPDASGTIHACADREGRLRVIDTEKGMTCRSRETPLSWSSTAATAPAQLPDAFVVVRSGSSVPPTGEVTEIAKLELPPGNYMVTAKAELGSQGTANDAPVRVFCSLEPGSPANDFAGVLLAPFSNPGDHEVITLLVSKELSAAGSVSLECSASGNVAGASVRQVVLRAVEVGTITSDPGPPPLP